ncbi:MAG: hypothetical protein M3552_10030 [Planctomycetota bacterium]|nr:hypothetical protein [Planctomycetaceae bacterium]MDQ3330977.1 hypothetical protein [Planctomycetota bacterium]
MFRHLLSAAVMTAGLGFAGTANEAQARDRHDHDRGRHHDRHHDHSRFDRGGHHHHRDHGRFDRGRYFIQPYPYHGRSNFRGGYYGRPGGFYGRPYGGGGIVIGTDRFQLGIFR